MGPLLKYIMWSLLTFQKMIFLIFFLNNVEGMHAHIFKVSLRNFVLWMNQSPDTQLNLMAVLSTLSHIAGSNASRVFCIRNSLLGQPVVYWVLSYFWSTQRVLIEGGSLESIHSAFWKQFLVNNSLICSFLILPTNIFFRTEKISWRAVS